MDPKEKQNDTVMWRFYLLFNSDTPDDSQLEQAFLDALKISRNRTFQIMLYCIDKQFRLCKDESFIKLIKVFTSTQELNITFKFKVVKALIRLNKWNIVVRILYEKPNAKLRTFVFRSIKRALEYSNKRCAACMPRKGEVANRIRGFLKLSPRAWREMLVPLCENQITVLMSAGRWSELDYSKLPTTLLIKYFHAIRRHDKERFDSYLRNTPLRESIILDVVWPDPDKPQKRRRLPMLSEVYSNAKYFGTDNQTSNQRNQKWHAPSAK